TYSGRRLPPHVGPANAGSLHDGIRAHPHSVLEIAVTWLGRAFHRLAADVVLPAVVDAAEATFLVASIEKVSAAMRTQRIHQADIAIGVSKRDQVLAQQSHPNRHAVGAPEIAGEQE